MRANREAFERRRLRPRMLTRQRRARRSVDVLGTPSPVPFFLAPIGVLSIAHADGELAAARAAAALRIPFILSSAASHSIEEIAEAMGDAPRWFQLYWVNDREICASFVRARRGRRLRGDRRHARHADARLASARPAATRTCRSSAARVARSSSPTPSSARASTKPPAEDMLTAAATMLSTFPNLRLTWDDLAWLREQTDAAAARQGRAHRGGRAARGRRAASTAIVVSNHGGRQVDGAVAALDALVEVRAARRRAAARRRRHPRRRRRRQGARARRRRGAARPAVRVRARGRRRGGRARRCSEQFAAETDLTLALARRARDVAELDSTWIAAS